MDGGLTVEASIDSTGLNQAAKDLTAGTAGGIAQVLTGQPFDCIKVRLQTQPERYSGALDCLKKTINNEGAFALYKGTLTPLVGIGAYVSLQFATYELAKRKLTVFQNSRPLTLTQYYICGALSGMSMSLLITPIELVRIRLQTQDDTAKDRFKGPKDCIQRTVRNYGMQGLFKGYWTTLIREIHGVGVYFLTYEALMKNDMKNNNYNRSDVSSSKLLLFGALAGYSMWITAYPVDVIKSRLQTDSPTKPKYHGMLDCARKMFFNEGIGSFARGFLPVLVRAAPVNAATFYTYETCRAYLYRS